MQQEQTKSESTIQITLETHEFEIMDRGISILAEDRIKHGTRLCFMHCCMGFSFVAASAGGLRGTGTASSGGNPQVEARRARFHWELDAIWFAAQEGLLEAKIVMEDFKRFGRSIAKE